MQQFPKFNQFQDLNTISSGDASISSQRRKDVQESPLGYTNGIEERKQFDSSSSLSSQNKTFNFWFCN